MCHFVVVYVLQELKKLNFYAIGMRDPDSEKKKRVADIHHLKQISLCVLLKNRYEQLFYTADFLMHRGKLE